MTCAMDGTCVCLLLLLLGVAGAVDAGQIVFPRPGPGWHHHHEDVVTTPQPARAPREIPLSLVRKLNEIDNLQDFIDTFVNKSTVPDGAYNLAERFGGTDERKSVQMAKQATCKPELITVPLNTSLNPQFFSWPSCTRIERCGGCCQHKLLNCQATETEIVNFQVLVIEYTGQDFLAQKRNEIIPIERHIKCKCDCIVKEKHCNHLQKYDSNDCACVCSNVDEEEKCRRDNDTKYWDSMECKCKCFQVRECSTGYNFDHNTCSCQQLNIRRRRIGESGLDFLTYFKESSDSVNGIPPFVIDGEHS